jgi:helix-turn-helix protein
MPRTTADTGVIEIMDVNLRQGFAQVPRPVLRAQGLSVKAKLVYVALLDYAWQQGSCYPGQERLAADLDISVDTVQRALAELKRFELVDWKQRGLNQTNVYRLLPLAENSHLFPDEAGNRKLRFPETAGLRFQETATSGTKNNQEEKYPDEDPSKFERAPDEPFADVGDAGRPARIAPEGPEPAPDASEARLGPPMPHAAGSRLLGPENAPDGPVPAHQGSPDGRGAFRAARAAMRATLTDQRRRDETRGRRSHRAEARPTSPPTPVGPVAPPAAADASLGRRRGRPVGSSAERELVGAFLGDFNAELLHDDAALPALITQAIHIFHAGAIPLAQWPDYLYQARTLVKERAGAITKVSTRDGERKNRGPYYFAVLRDLVAADREERAGP